MKVIVTPETFDILGRLKNSQVLSKLRHPPMKRSRTVNKLKGNNLLPEIKTATEISVNIPRIRIGKEFSFKYLNQSRMAEDRIMEGLNKSLCLPRDSPYKKNVLEKRISKAKTRQQLNTVEAKLKKLIMVHNLKQARYENAIERAKLLYRKMQGRETEWFGSEIEYLTKEFNKKLDTRKKCKRERIVGASFNKYKKLWDSTLIRRLSNPKDIKVKFVNLIHTPSMY